MVHVLSRQMQPVFRTSIAEAGIFLMSWKHRSVWRDGYTSAAAVLLWQPLPTFKIGRSKLRESFVCFTLPWSPTWRAVT